jgi:hypothetical protein
MDGQAENFEALRLQPTCQRPGTWNQFPEVRRSGIPTEVVCGVARR